MISISHLSDVSVTLESYVGLNVYAVHHLSDETCRGVEIDLFCSNQLSQGIGTLRNKPAFMPAR